MARILIIDDDEQIRAMLRQALELEEYEVQEARNGSEGIRFYRQNPTDLVITDMIMPEKEGMETIFDLKTEFPDAKIIAISGGDRIAPEQYLEVAERLGAVRVLAKPFRIQDLLRWIGTLIE